ncbi:uncharacterized protein MYCFIDRAFT_210921 [Pseudocercospora fijiensis CIRAD86]|uniref:Uncharacterized protein n=1 Tax=Pseudocercospora fijiensis (strain CIRAD86) TaxID=383855 RepID=M3B5G3_PSEFD|nr:uncharacterized protein MYCFIDRAFT_210921 [Pseudocercospora fijiensis CIRAD86]EME84598.1 hypothetical protein MYCFIDRAFT_210921 [Pseudocercospora fijiensis CIRAD86]
MRQLDEVRARKSAILWKEILVASTVSCLYRSQHRPGGGVMRSSSLDERRAQGSSSVMSPWTPEAQPLQPRRAPLPLHPRIDRVHGWSQAQTGHSRSGHSRSGHSRSSDAVLELERDLRQRLNAAAAFYVADVLLRVSRQVLFAERRDRVQKESC